MEGVRGGVGRAMRENEEGVETDRHRKKERGIEHEREDRRRIPRERG